jgi:uncharacterized protein (DUF4415 family)
MEAALAAAPPDGKATGIDWSKATRTSGGGVAATIAQLRKARGKNKTPAKEQIAIRLDPDILAAFRASGPGWQTRVNTVLKNWLAKNAKALAARTNG